MILTPLFLQQLQYQSGANLAQVARSWIEHDIQSPLPFP